MKQAQLDHAVAHATGESVRTIQRHGFCLLVMSPGKQKQPPQKALMAPTGVERRTAARSA